MRKTGQKLRDNFKRCDMWIIEIPEEERENGADSMFELMAENFPKLMTENQTMDPGSSENTTG